MAVDEKTRANDRLQAVSNIILRGDSEGGGKKRVYDTNEESKTLESSDNEVRRDEFTQSRCFRGGRALLIVVKYSIILPEYRGTRP